MRPLLCAQTRLTARPFAWPACDSAPQTFVVRDFEVPGLSSLVGPVRGSEFMVHCAVIALFAGLVAPFGGFFASGLKRALRIKDFADVIPGHGGLTDRFDCLLVMTVFVSVYVREIVQGRLGSVWLSALAMDRSNQEQLYKRLGELLAQS